MARSDRMYRDSPKMERDEGGKMSVKKATATAKPKHPMGEMHGRHAREHEEMNKRHLDEHKALNEKHEKEASAAEAALPDPAAAAPAAAPAPAPAAAPPA